MTLPNAELGVIIDAVERRAVAANPEVEAETVRSVAGLLTEASRDRWGFTNGFTEIVWIATAILRRQGRGPTLVLTRPADVTSLNHRIRPALEKMGLRLGFDVIVYGLLEPSSDDLEYSMVWVDDEPLFDEETLGGPVLTETDVDETWSDLKCVEPGLVALMRESDDDAAIPADVDSWLYSLPEEVPVIQGIDDWEHPATPARFHNCTPPVRPAGTIRRPTESREIAAQLQRWSAQIVSITGATGTGRSSLISEVAAQLERSEQPMTFRSLRVRGETAIKSLEMQLRHAVTNEARVPEVIVIDDFDQIAKLEAGGQADKELIDQIEQICATGAVRFLIVLREDRLDALAQTNNELAERIVHVRLGDLPRADLEEIVRQHTDLRVSAAGMELTDEALDRALSPSMAPTRQGQPALAINRIEAALARARLRRSRTLTTDDFEVGPRTAKAPNASSLRATLRGRVRGQDEAIDAIVNAVVPPMAGFKIRQNRPHAVLLFAGPSGVGKTETAKQLAKAAYGSEQAIIRLDMSEYANEDDARMKLIGASRIWKGSSTSGLLTTKVIDKPRCVVLLDEFEKAHPYVWNLFLQVFDEGRLTDGWGRVASFSETIIVMTSNLGAREGSVLTAGFGAADGYKVSRQDAAIAEAMPPELLNRITSTVPFSPLSSATIRDLARVELERVVTRLSKRGWNIEFNDDVVDFLADSGHDDRYGARELQRRIETEIFPLLTAAPIPIARLIAGPSGLSISSPTGTDATKRSLDASFPEL